MFLVCTDETFRRLLCRGIQNGVILECVSKLTWFQRWSSYYFAFCVRNHSWLSFSVKIAIYSISVGVSKLSFFFAFVCASRNYMDDIWIGGDLVLCAERKWLDFKCGERLTWFSYGWSKLTWFFMRAENNVVLSVSIEFDLGSVWVVHLLTWFQRRYHSDLVVSRVVEFDLISVWTMGIDFDFSVGIGIDFVFVWRPKLTCSWGAKRHKPLLSGHRNRHFIRMGDRSWLDISERVEIIFVFGSGLTVDLVLLWGSKSTRFFCGGQNWLRFCVPADITLLIYGLKKWLGFVCYTKTTRF